MKRRDDSPADPSSERVFDRDALIDLVDGDLAFASQLVNLFLENLDRYMAAVRAAIESNSSRALQGAAHELTGALGTMQATAAMEAAHALTEMARQDDLSQAPAGLAALEDELRRLRPALLTLR